MNKGYRNALLLAMVLAVVGVVFVIGGAIFGGFSQIKNADLGHRLGLVRFGYMDKRISTSAVADGSFDIDDIEKLEINIGAADVEIVEVSGNKISIASENTVTESEIKGDTLVIENDSDDFVKDAYVKIEIPKGTHFSEIDMDLGAVRATIDGLDCDKLKLKVGAGEAKIEKGKIEDADIEVGAGNLIYSGSITGDLDAKCGLGNMTFQLDGDEDDHNYDLEVGLGNMRVAKDRIGGMGSRKVNNNAESDYVIECGAGNVEVTFD